MEALFQFLKANPFLLLFLTVGLAVWIGKSRSRDMGSAWSPRRSLLESLSPPGHRPYGVKLQLDNFAKSLMYYLFMYGRRIAGRPVLFQQFEEGRLDLHHPRRGLRRSRAWSWSWPSAGYLGCPQARWAEFSPGPRPCRRRSARQKWRQPGAYKMPAGATAEGVSAMIALGYGISYIWGTVGIILICKYLPKWWGVDAKKAAKEYEEKIRRAEPG